MKVLFLSPFYPMPLTTGSAIRTFNLIKAYSRIADVTLISLSKEDPSVEMKQELSLYCSKVVLFDTKEILGSKLRGIKFSEYKVSFSTWIPLFIKKYYCEKLISFLDNIDLEKYDVLHVERMHMSINAFKVLKKAPNKMLKIIDIDDNDSTRIFRELRCPFSLKYKILMVGDLLKLLYFKKLIFNKYDISLLSSDKDYRKLDKRGSRRFILFPNGANIPDKNMTFTFPKTLLFLGSMSYEANQDAITYFYNNIFPTIKKAVPDVKLIIAGKEPSEEVMTLQRDPNVVVAGYVKNALDEFRKCTALIVPLRMGAGTRLKILEAMSAGKPVISTSIGCEGLDVEHDKNIIIADRQDVFARECIELLNNMKKGDFIGKNGLKLVKEKYSWDMIAQNFADTLETIL